MSWADNYLKQQQGAQQARQAGGNPFDDQSWTGGFLSSTLSSIPELFGEKPTDSAEAFRISHPWSGFASQMLGSVVPYAGVGALSATEAGAGLLGRAMKAVPGVKALNTVDNPILYQAAKEAIRYSPVEIARLGVGLGTTDDWKDYGNLFADVGLSTLLTGGFGGIGGFFKMGGKVNAELGGIKGSPMGLRPTFEYRLSLTPEAEPAIRGADMGAVRENLMRTVFSETPSKSLMPGQKGRYLNGLEGGNPETNALVESLFSPKPGEGAKLQRMPLMDQNGNWRLDDGAQQELFGALAEKSGGAIRDASSMAENMVFPRLINVKDARAAGTISKALDDSAMQWVSDGVMAGKEAEGGLHVMAVRLRAGAGDVGVTDARFVGQVPDTGVVPANMGQDGKIYLGDPNTSHYHVFEKHPELQGQSPKSTGFVTADGQYLNREEAFTWLKQQGKIIKPSPNMGKTELDALDYRDQTRGTKFGATVETKEPPKIGQGDQWLIFKTDKPNLFAPEGYKLAQSTVAEWSKFRAAFGPIASNDFASSAIRNFSDYFGIQDVQDAIKLPKQTAVSRIMGRLTNKFADTTGLTGSQTLKWMAEGFYDKMAPTVVNERRSPMFARMFGTLRAAKEAGQELINKAVGGQVQLKKGGIWTRKNFEHEDGLLPGRGTVAKQFAKLSDEDRGNLYRIQTAQAPLDELEKYTANGQVSDNLRETVQYLRDIDQTMWEQHIRPGFEAGSVSSKFDLLEGYIGPRMFTGDHRFEVLDSKGNLAWLAAGTRRQAQAEANAVIAEAKAAGKELKLGKDYAIGLGKNPDEIKNLHDLVEIQLGQDADMHDVIMRAMRKMAMDQRAKTTHGSLPKTPFPDSMMSKRTGLAGSPDRHIPTASELTEAWKNHYERLMNFTATKVWESRFAEEAQLMSKHEPTLYADLMRKKNQMMGYEGRYTQALNQALGETILGKAYGGKAATKIALQTNELMYNWNLAIMNPTFSVLNVLQPIQTVLPHLTMLLSAMKRGFTDVIEQDMHMTLRYGADGLPREVIGVMSPAKIMARAIKLMSKPEPELMDILSRMKTRGSLGAQLFEGWYGGQARGLETIKDAFNNAGGGVAGTWEATKRIATFTAERSEEMSRGIAANSYYILGKDYLGLEGEKLLQWVERGTRNSMFGYSLMDRSRIFTGPVGSMFGLFKNWQMHFISSMFQYAGLAWNKGMWGPLLWQFGAAGAMGGLGAMGPLKWTADAIAKWHDGNQNSYLWMQEHWHDSADEVYFGLPALLGASLQASSTLPGTDVRNDITSLSNFVFIERAKAAGKAVGAAWDYHSANGQNPLAQGNIRDQLMQAFAPRAFFRAFSSVEGDYVKSMSTGYAQVRDVSPLGKFLHGMGLNQVEVERQQVAARELWKNQEAQRTTIQQLGISLADAQSAGDFHAMEIIQRKAVAAGVPITSVYKSARTRLNRANNQDIMSRFKGDMVQKYQQGWQE